MQNLLVPPVGWSRVTALGAHYALRAFLAPRAPWSSAESYSSLYLSTPARFAARPGAPAKRVLESCAETSSDAKLSARNPIPIR